MDLFHHLSLYCSHLFINQLKALAKKIRRAATPTAETDVRQNCSDNTLSMEMQNMKLDWQHIQMKSISFETNNITFENLFYRIKSISKFGHTHSHQIAALIIMAENWKQ